MAVVDVTDAGQVEAAVEATLRDAGRLDILINNAAVLGDVAEIWRCDPGNWRRVIDVNLTGAFLCMRSVVPAMRRHHQGRIVNVASIQAKEGTPLSGAYAAAKAGLVAVTKTLGKELATSGITVNCVTPSAFESKMFEQIDKKRRDGILARIPMGRFCSPEEVAAMIAWICSPECSFSTGAVFDISGGRATY
jgi:3-oxoacyl-[acyl-carrier protein] reductase